MTPEGLLPRHRRRARGPTRSGRARLGVRLGVLVGLGLSGAASAPAQVLVPPGATWSYLDTGSYPGPSWVKRNFNDSSWPKGPGQLGHGDGDEGTIVDYGSDPNNKHLTTWFRHQFPTPASGRPKALALRLQADDGAVVYLNGLEAVRARLPGGTITPSTLATEMVDGASEEAMEWFVVDPSYLVRSGTNTLAVEVHLWDPASVDLSFDLQVLGAPSSHLSLGPYLQTATPSSILVRWRTDRPTDSIVWFGRQAGIYSNLVSDPTATADHQIALTNLQPGTRYYYAVGSSDGVLAGGDTSHTFLTSPATGDRDPMHLWAFGDVGTGRDDADRVKQAVQAATGRTAPDALLLLGDNAYMEGSPTDFLAGLYDNYPDVLRGTVTWPCLGNHEEDLGYYQALFSLPTAGEAGGVPSRTENYYSFDRGNVHVLALDSEYAIRNQGGPMWKWVQRDLAATNQDWIIAFWHHAPYSKGNHDSDVERPLIDMRQNFAPLLEAYGVDLVLCGHSHSYERSFLLDGHYGDSTTFQNSMKVDGGDGRPGGSGAYQKDRGPNRGTVYLVCGASARTSSGPLNHPAMYLSTETLCAVTLDIQGDRLDATVLDDQGAVIDWFTIQHSPWTDLGNALAGALGAPDLIGQGDLSAGSPVQMDLTNAAPRAPVTLVIGGAPLFAPFAGGVMVPAPQFLVNRRTDAQGALSLAGTMPPGLPSDFLLYFQAWIADASGPSGFTASNALSGRLP